MIPRAFVVSAVLGFLETLVTYATGFTPAADVALILAGSLLVGAVWAAAVAAGLYVVARLARRPDLADGRVRDLLLLLFPALLLSGRGSVDANQVHYPWAETARWGLGLVVVAGLVLATHGRRARGSDPLPTASVYALALVSQLVLVAGLSARSTHHTVIRAQLLASPLERILLPLVAVAVAALGALVWNRRERERPRREPAYAAACGLLLLSAAVAFQLRSRPPRLPALVREPVPAQATALPDVLLIVMDTVRRDHVSAYGYPRATTPQLDALASHALLFEQALATAGYSLASHASLFTGKLPSEHGAHPIPRGAREDRATSPGHYRLRDAVSTLAEDLGRRGYLTAGVSANDVFLAEWTGLQRGFEAFEAVGRRSPRYVPTSMPLVSRLGERARRLVRYHEAWPAATITDAAIGWLRQQRARPRFLFLNYFDAHEPHDPPEGYGSRFAEDGATPARRQENLYDAEIAYVDAEVGRLFAWLRHDRSYDGTLIVVTADHGEYFGERGLTGHPDTPYEPGLGVPLLVKLPGQAAPHRAPARTSLADVRGLVARVVEGERDPVRLATEAAVAGPRVLAESWHATRPNRLPASQPRMRAIYHGRFKLIVRAVDPSEVYDLVADPAETRNLLVHDPPLGAAIERSLRRALAAGGQAAPDRALPELAPDVLEKLRSLGYLGRE